MLRFASIAPSRRNANCLLFLGLLVMALYALAGSGLTRARMAMGGGEQFVAEVCTSHGVFAPAPALLADPGVPADVARHDCCKLCAGAGSLLAAQIVIGVSPAPTFLVRLNSPASALRPLDVALAPSARGPPARA